MKFISHFVVNDIQNGFFHSITRSLFGQHTCVWLNWYQNQQLVLFFGIKSMKVNNIYDLMHTDGWHSTEVANSDITCSYRLTKQETIIIMNDYDFGNLHYLWDSYIIKYDLNKFDTNVYNSPYYTIWNVCKL